MATIQNVNQRVASGASGAASNAFANANQALAKAAKTTGQAVSTAQVKSNQVSQALDLAPPPVSLGGIGNLAYGLLNPAPATSKAAVTTGLLTPVLRGVSAATNAVSKLNNGAFAPAAGFINSLIGEAGSPSTGLTTAIAQTTTNVLGSDPKTIPGMISLSLAGLTGTDTAPNTPSLYNPVIQAEAGLLGVGSDQPAPSQAIDPQVALKTLQNLQSQGVKLPNESTPGTMLDALYQSVNDSRYHENSPLSFLGPILQLIHWGASLPFDITGISSLPIFAEFDTTAVHPALWDPFSAITDYPVNNQPPGEGQNNPLQHERQPAIIGVLQFLNLGQL